MATKSAVQSALGPLGTRTPQIGFVFASPKHDLRKVLGIAAEMLPRTQLMGASTAGEINDRGLTHGGISLMLVASDELVHSMSVASDISKSHAAAAQVLCRDFEEVAKAAMQRGLANSTTVLLADTLTSPAEWLVNEVRRATRPQQRIVGGAPGDDGALKATYAGIPGKVGLDTAVAMHLFTQKPWGIGVEHGLRPVTEKKTVTKASGALIQEIDGKPAYQMFEEYIKANNLHVPEDKRMEFVVRNELGVFFLDNICKVRAIHQITPDGSLVSTGEIPKGSSICVVTGEPDALVAATRQAAEEAQKGLKGAKAAGVLVFSCYCRTLILGTQFKREVDAVREVFPETPISGFVTYGEIARFSGRLDGYHNTTVVVAAIPA